MTVVRHAGPRKRRAAEWDGLPDSSEAASTAGVPAQRRSESPPLVGTDGPPLRELEEVHSHDGVLQHALRVTAAHVQAGSHTGSADADRPAPGEVLRVRPGDRLRLRIHNATASADVPVTGPQVSAAGVNDNVFVRVPPDSSHQYDYEIPADKPAGLHWYHPHVRGAMTHPAGTGLAGPIIVEGDIDQVPGIAEARDRVLVVGGRAAGGTHPAPPVLRVNGDIRPEIDSRPGEIQRWRVLNADPERAVWLHVEGHTLHHIGHDGIPFARVRPVQSIMLAPGNRAEFLMRANRAGAYRVYAQGCHDDASDHVAPATVLATMLVKGRPIFSRLPRQLADPPLLQTGPVARRRTVHIGRGKADVDGAGGRFLVDGREFSPDTWAREAAGTVEEWVVVNDDEIQRPLHILANPFQVIDVEGAPAGDPSWRADPEIWMDTYRVPPRGQVTIRISFRFSA